MFQWEQVKDDGGHLEMEPSGIYFEGRMEWLWSGEREREESEMTKVVGLKH